MSFTKSDLVYKDYKWTARSDKDNPKIRGGKDHEYLNRLEGYEMLDFLNDFMKENGYTLLASFQRAEKHLRTSKSGEQTHSAWKKEIKANNTF